MTRGGGEPADCNRALTMPWPGSHRWHWHGGDSILEHGVDPHGGTYRLKVAIFRILLRPSDCNLNRENYNIRGAFHLIKAGCAA